MHIPKTAGTSFRTFLEQQFAASELSDCYGLRQFCSAIREGRPAWKLLCGHLGATPLAWLGSEARVLTILRDPVARTVSHYKHIVSINRNSWLFGQLGTAHPTLEQFLDCPATRQLVTNFQARHIVQEFTLNETTGLGRLLATTPFPGTDDELLQRAQRRLDTFALVGTVARLEEAINDATQRFGWRAPDRVPVVNVAESRNVELSTASLATIQSITRVDRTLYEIFSKLGSRPPAVLAP